MRVWLLLGAVVATITTTKVFGLVGDSSIAHDAISERFDAWYGDMDEEVAVEYVADFSRLEEQLTTMDAVVEQRDTLPIHQWVVTKGKKSKPQRIKEQRLRLKDDVAVVPIEVFEGDTIPEQFNAFVDKLIWGDEVRIAFMGDSFVEGDILTSDFREKMQETFGGRGVGFVQCDIPFSTARRTVKRVAKGWESYSVLKPKKNPADINDAFFVSGYTARGKSGATVSWQTTTAFEHLDSCSRARVLLTTPDSLASVRVMLNRDTTLVREFDLVGVGLPQQIFIEGGVESLDMEVLSGTVDCYGASLEDVGGVIVDNLSMRANNGHAIFGTSAIVNRQIDAYVGYDLVVLQYGLNIMEAGKSNYAGYRNKVVEMVAYAKSCFPDAAILVLGVSDRWAKNAESGEYEPMSSVGAMTSYQREAAERSGASFWATADAMALYGSMPGFVANSWAAKDHTHINFAGGKRLGEELYKSIVSYAYQRLKSGKSVSPIPAITPSQPVKITTKPVDDSVAIVSPTTASKGADDAETAAPTSDVGVNDSIIVEEPDASSQAEGDAPVDAPVDAPMEGTAGEEQQDSEEIVERSTIVDDADVEEFFETTI